MSKWAPIMANLAAAQGKADALANLAGTDARGRIAKELAASLEDLRRELFAAIEADIEEMRDRIAALSDSRDAEDWKRSCQSGPSPFAKPRIREAPPHG